LVVVAQLLSYRTHSLESSIQSPGFPYATKATQCFDIIGMEGK